MKRAIVVSFGMAFQHTRTSKVLTERMRSDAHIDDVKTGDGGHETTGDL